jgi:hypothetical protein
MSTTSHHNNNTTTLVYVKSKDQAWLPAQVVEGTDDGSTVTVHVRGDGPSPVISTMTVSLKDYPHQSLPLQNIDPSTGKLRVVADLADLSFLHEVRCTKEYRSCGWYNIHVWTKPHIVSVSFIGSHFVQHQASSQYLETALHKDG